MRARDAPVLIEQRGARGEGVVQHPDFRRVTLEIEADLVGHALNGAGFGGEARPIGAREGHDVERLRFGHHGEHLEIGILDWRHGIGAGAEGLIEARRLRSGVASVPR